MALAQTPEEKEVQVNISGIQGPCLLRYRERGQAQWLQTDLPAAAGSSTRVRLERGKEHLFEVYQRSLFWERWGQSEVVHPLDAEVPVLVRQTRPRWVPLGLMALTAGGLGLLARRRRAGGPSVYWDAHEPLIRSDGKVPARPVGAYQLTRILGSGGMGVVYLGQNAAGESVAIKVPAPHLIAQDDFRKRFFREIQLGMELRHPRVVQVLELPLEDELYVVMEYVEGQPLDTVPAGPWANELKQVLLWGEQALEALEFIHSKGVIHRDLKPSNLMVLPDKSLKLMDFGIAHSIHGTRLTGTGNILGTPVYMAPEQLQGVQIDPRADLYSLGVILYERLLGGLPFPTEVMDLLRYKLSTPLKPLSEAGCPVPPAVDLFISRMVAQNPIDRFQTAAAALASIRKCMGR